MIMLQTHFLEHFLMVMKLKFFHFHLYNLHMKMPFFPLNVNMLLHISVIKKKILEFLILPTRRISHIYGGH